MNNYLYLPNFSTYGVTRDGRVINHRTDHWLGEANQEGYVTIHLRGDNDERLVISRHRLVALLYVPNPRPEVNVVVNHCDGVPGHDWADNLEWTTHQGNIEHAGSMGLTEKCHPLSVRNPTNGEVRHYPSAVAAARDLNITKDAVLWRLNDAESRIYPEGLQYRHRDDSRPWQEGVSFHFGRSVAVVCKDLMSGEIRTFERQSDLAGVLGMSLAAINISASTGEQRVLQGRYVVKLESDTSPWREIADPLREVRSKRPVKVVEHATGHERVFASAKDCAEAMGLKPTTLNERLKLGGIRAFKDGHRYLYY